ncbi:MAG: N-acetylmuramoyl-L-alanine amidase family protein [Chthoniobacterales bacterium]
MIALILACGPGTLEAASRKYSTVIIDAGHGGFDRGGVPGQRVAEKTMCLDVAQRLAKDLRSAGYRVIMTRDSDVFIPLGERVRIANRYHDAIFVCIHFNSAQREGANGIETYYYSNNSAKLAADIHRQVIGGTTTENRGIRRRGYFVLRKTSIPAVLVECGFLTNRDETRLILQSSYRERLADKIAAGIMEKPTPPNRSVVAGVTHVTPPISQPFKYNDFVRAEPDRRPTHRRSSKSSSHRKSSSSKKKSSSSSRKKSTSSSSKKSSSSGTKKKSSTSKTKKKKKTDSDE